MGFFDGLLSFLKVFSRILTERRPRKLYFRQVLRALVFGFVFWLLCFGLFGGLLWFLFESYQSYLPWLWLESVTGLGLVVLWLIVTYFTSGPITLLFVGLYLSQVTPWRKMESELQMELPPMHEVGLLKSIPLSAWRMLLLILVILIAVLLSVVPPFVLLTPFLTAYALGKDWVWTARDLFRFRPKALLKSDFSYSVGLGLIPSLLSSFPFLGLLCLPIMQAASLIPYEEKTTIAKDD